MAVPDSGRNHDPKVWRYFAWRRDLRTHLYIRFNCAVVRAGNQRQTFAGVSGRSSLPAVCAASQGGKHYYAAADLSYWTDSPQLQYRSEERRVGKSVDLGG